MAVSEWKKHEKELRELQQDNAEGRMAYQPAEVHADVVVASEDEDGNPTVDKKGEVHALGGYVYLEVSGRFRQGDVFALQKQLATAFQAVS